MPFDHTWTIRTGTFAAPLSQAATYGLSRGRGRQAIDALVVALCENCDEAATVGRLTGRDGVRPLGDGVAVQAVEEDPVDDH